MDQAALLDAYLGGPDRLRSAVTGLSREQLISRPIAGRWSVLEVVCHLVDTDANIAHRIKRVLSEERPVFDRVKPELMLAALAYHDRDVEDELGIFDLDETPDRSHPEGLTIRRRGNGQESSAIAAIGRSAR